MEHRKIYETNQATKSYKKVCKKCQKKKKISDYHNDKSKVNGKRSICKTCCSEKDRERYAKERESILAKNKAYKVRNHYRVLAVAREYKKNQSIKVLLMAAKKRARMLDIDFSLKESDLEIPDKCPLLGIELNKVLGGDRDFSPSLDRKDPAKGYTLDNVAIISNRANRIKNDATIEELVLIGERIRKYAEN